MQKGNLLTTGESTAIILTPCFDSTNSRQSATINREVPLDAQQASAFDEGLFIDVNYKLRVNRGKKLIQAGIKKL